MTQKIERKHHFNVLICLILSHHCSLSRQRLSNWKYYFMTSTENHCNYQSWTNNHCLGGMCNMYIPNLRFVFSQKLSFLRKKLSFLRQKLPILWQNLLFGYWKHLIVIAEMHIQLILFVKVKINQLIIANFSNQLIVKFLFLKTVNNEWIIF